LSYVSVWKPVRDRIVKASVESRNEIIGLLVGHLDGDALIIEDSITGEFSSEPHRVILPPDTIARIADDILKGRLKGNIVGWYHSHTEDGVFFSDTDVESQRILQQFSPLTVGMVVDSKTSKVGYFRLDSNGEPIRLPEEKVNVYSEKPEAPVRPPRPRRIRTPAMQLKPSTKLIVTALLVTLIGSLMFVGVVVNRTPPPALIHHIPVTAAAVGSPISITANATGVRNMTLFYASSASHASAEMKATAPNTYQYVIPGSQVIGNLTYYMEAFTETGGTVTTEMFHVTVSDFNISIANQTLLVYRNSTEPVSTDVNVIPISAFDQMVTVSAAEAPNGVKVAFSQNQGLPGTIFRLGLTASPSAQLESFPLMISASYAPNGSQPVTRSGKLIVTVADFSIDVSPSNSSVTEGSQAPFTLNLSFSYGFEAPLTLTVLGLPQGAKIALMPTNEFILLNGPGSHPFVINTGGVKRGTYTITLIALAKPSTGGSIAHSETIQLTVR